MADLLNESSNRVQTLLDRFSAFPPSTGARPDAEELVRIISSLYGEGLRRMIQALRHSLDGRTDELIEACCADPIVASLLITHGLHPVPLEERVRRALDGVRGELRAKGGDAELIRADEDVVSVRIDGMSDLIPIVERAVYASAPEVLEVRAVGHTVSLLNVR
jgi:Fe-S cluster biogenesis protein NfuA